MALLGINYVVIRFLFRHRRLDQLVEGRSVVLIADGKPCRRAMARELLTISELLTVVHRQGFAHIKDVERCVLEPGGTFYIEGKEPRSPERQHRELMERLDQLGRQVEELKQQLARE